MALMSELILDADGCGYYVLYVQNARYTSTTEILASKTSQYIIWDQKSAVKYKAKHDKEGSASENDVILPYLDLCLIT